MPEIPQDTLKAVWDICKSLENVFEARGLEDDGKYRQALEKIPNAWQSRYHELLQMCVQVVITFCELRRGHGDLRALTKDQYQLREEGDVKFYEKVNRKKLRHFVFV